jgi:hypothetical protein
VAARPPNAARLAQLERLISSGATASAEALLDELEASPGGRPQALLGRAELALALGRDDEAETLAERAIELGLARRGHLVRGQAALHAGRLDDAARDFAHVLLLAPGDVDAAAGLQLIERAHGGRAADEAF